MWPKWLNFGFTWTLPTFSKRQKKDHYDKDVDWKKRAENLDKFDTKREQIIRELEEGK